MTDKSEQNTGFESFVADWMKNSMSFWTSMPSIWSGINKAFTTVSDQQKDGKDRISTSFKTAQKTWESLSQAMSEPETLQTLFKGTGVLPEICLKIAQTGLNNFTYYQQQWVKKTGKVHESTKAYRFENLDEDMVKIWSELYEKEFRKFFNIPQLGLTRFYQEKFAGALDKYNIFQASVSEFFHLLSLPMEKSFHVMQEELAGMADEGNIPKDSKEYYRMWIKILEGHYMVLFQSSEYTQALNKTLGAMSDFSNAKKEFLQDTMIYMLPVPTQKEMDELYKEIYHLKKRIKELEKHTT